MKFLLDANLSPRLVKRLADLFPVAHVFDLGLAQNTPDDVIWEHAGQNGYTILTADSDFVDLSRRRGFPPKVIRIENCTFRKAEIEELIRRNAVRIARFAESDEAVLVLRRRVKQPASRRKSR